MGILRIVNSGIRGKNTQTFIIFIITLLILLFELTGLSIQSASKLAEEDVYKQIGLRIKIAPNANIQDYSKITITDEMINDIMKIDHVVGYDSSLESFCTPVNFKNLKIHTGVSPDTQNEQAIIPSEDIAVSREQISLTGGLNIKYNERFYKGQNSLIEGDFPDENHEGAIVSEQIAVENNLKTGEMITLRHESGQKADIKIIGIYQTNLKFEVAETNLFGEGIFSSSPYNVIYTNYSTVNRLENEACPVIFLTVWIDSPQYIQVVMDQISNDELWKDFSAYDITGIVFTQYAQQIISIDSMSESLVFLSMLFGGIILIIVMTFFGSSYMYETGLYIVLGLNRLGIFLIQLLQVFLIVFAALLASLILSPFLMRILNNVIEVNYISVTNDSTVYSYYTGDMDIQQNFHVSIAPEIFAGMAVALFILTVISAVIPFLATIYLKPKDILAGNKKG